MKIKGILHMFIPATFDGTTYFRYTDTETGNMVAARAFAGESNVRGALYELEGGEWASDRYYVAILELPIRRYNALVKHAQEVSGNPKDIAEFIRKELEEKKLTQGQSADS